MPGPLAFSAAFHRAFELGDHRPALAGPGRQGRRREAAELEVFGAAGVQHLHVHYVVALLDPVAPLVVIGGAGGGIFAKEEDGVGFVFNPGVSETTIARPGAAGAG